jgi:hypothetical protein
MADQNQDNDLKFTVYRGFYPVDAHQAYVFLRALQNNAATVPDHPTHVPLRNDSTIPDSFD